MLKVYFFLLSDFKIFISILYYQAFRAVSLTQSKNLSVIKSKLKTVSTIFTLLRLIPVGSDGQFVHYLLYLFDFFKPTVKS